MPTVAVHASADVEYAGARDPAGQLAHEPPLRKEFAGQPHALALVAPTGETKPAGQAAHALPLRYEPAEQDASSTYIVPDAEGTEAVQVPGTMFAHDMIGMLQLAS